MFLRAVLRYWYRYDDPQNKYEANMNYDYDQVQGWMRSLYRLNHSLQLKYPTPVAFEHPRECADGRDSVPIYALLFATRCACG